MESGYFDTYKKLLDRAYIQNEIRLRRLKSIYSSGRFTEYLERAIKKYSSREDSDKALLWLALDYAREFGRLCTTEEFNEHYDEHVSELAYCDGYIFKVLYIEKKFSIEILKTK